MTAASASASKQDGSDPESQPNDPAAQKSSPSQPQPNTPVTNSDPKGGNDPQQDSHPNHGSDSNADSGQDEDPNQADRYHGSNHDADLVSGFGPSALREGTSTVPLTPGVSKSITTTIAGKAIIAAPNAATIAGTTIRPGAPGMTLVGNVISVNTASQLIIGSTTIALGSASKSPITTIIGDQVTTAAPEGITIPGTALSPGASHVFVGGTLVSLNTAGQLIVGPETIALQSGQSTSDGPMREELGVGIPSSAAAAVRDPVTITVDGQLITAEPTALAAMVGTTLTAGSSGEKNVGVEVLIFGSTLQGNNNASVRAENGSRNATGTGTGGQIFRGRAAALRGGGGCGGLVGRRRRMAVAVSVGIWVYMRCLTP